MMRIGIAVALLATLGLASTGQAAKLVKGNSVVWIGLHGDRAQLISDDNQEVFNSDGNPIGPNFFEYGEPGMDLALSYFVTDNWNINLAGDISGARNTFEEKGGQESRSTSTSYDIRFGGDRYAFITDNVAVYAGPGIRYWKGRVKDNGHSSPDVNQIGLNGRLGFWTRLGSHYGLYGHIGQVVGYNTADLPETTGATPEPGGRARWYSSHHEGSVGLALDF
jgi:outer membrane protein with beta-barrel domain